MLRPSAYATLIFSIINLPKLITTLLFVIDGLECCQSGLKLHEMPTYFNLVLKVITSVGDGFFLVFSFKITVMVLSPRKKMKPCVWFQSGY
jgi:hypothetical protein